MLFIPAYRLVQDMLAAKRDLELPRMLRKLDNFGLLVIDELPPAGSRTRRNLDPKDTSGATPLMLASTSGYPRFVERLLELGADHSLSDNSGRSALHLAAESARNEVVRVLIDGGADIHCTDDIGDTPLHLATTRGHESTVRLLLESGSDPNTADSAFSSTPLHKAVRGDHAYAGRWTRPTKMGVPLCTLRLATDTSIPCGL